MNLCKARQSARFGIQKKNYVSGENIKIKIPNGDTAFINSKNLRKTKLITTLDGTALFIPNEYGVYDLRFSQNTALNTTFTVNPVSPEESDLANLKSCIYGQEKLKTLHHIVWHDFFWIFILLAFLTALLRIFLICKQEGALYFVKAKDY